jgi:DNA invertase Pin-like site-specific DNA recombinase
LNARKAATMPVKAVAYIRGPRVLESGWAKEHNRQCEAVSEFIKRSGWVLVGRYADEESGPRKKSSRHELAKAIVHAARERATLVIAKLQGLTRNASVLHTLATAGVAILALDLADIDEVAIRTLSTVASKDAAAISVRTKAALRALQEGGVELGNKSNLLDSGGPRKGAETRHARAITAYAHLLPEIERLRAEGASLRAVAASMNNRGITTVEGCQFTASTITRILGRTRNNT